MFKRVADQIGSNYAGRHVRLILDGNHIDFIDSDTGEVLAEHTIPATGVRYVSNGQPRGPRRPPEVSAMS